MTTREDQIPLLMDWAIDSICVSHKRPDVQHKPHKKQQNTGIHKGTDNLGSCFVERGSSIALNSWVFMFAEFAKLASSCSLGISSTKAFISCCCEIYRD